MKSAGNLSDKTLQKELGSAAGRLAADVWCRGHSVYDPHHSTLVVSMGQPSDTRSIPLTGCNSVVCFCSSESVLLLYFFHHCWS
jgi:hypothetical protein